METLVWLAQHALGLVGCLFIILWARWSLHQIREKNKRIEMTPHFEAAAQKLLELGELISETRLVDCPDCNGTGMVTSEGGQVSHPASNEACPQCSGSGKVKGKDTPHVPHCVVITCPFCEGLGELPSLEEDYPVFEVDPTCRDCRGTGWVVKEEMSEPPSQPFKECSECSGTGEAPPLDMIEGYPVPEGDGKCLQCRGSGFASCACPTCYGMGSRDNGASGCATCEGTGRLPV